MLIEVSLAPDEEQGSARCRVKALRSAARVAYNVIAGDGQPTVVRACNINLARTLAKNFSIDCIV